MKPIILASSSPRRKELLEKHQIDFRIEYKEIEEILDQSLSLSKRLEKLAYQKAEPIAKKYPNDIVIGADTMVVLDDEMLGKPKDKDDAKRMLKNMSAKRQVVYSAVAIFEGEQVTTFCDQCGVIFKPLSEQEIEEYLLEDEWIGKAGGYAIQGIAGKFVDHIDGDIETVIGLPVRMIKEYLNTRNNK